MICAVPHPIAGPRLRQEVRRQGHALHAGGHDHFDVAALDGLRGEHDGFEARAAHLVDRGGADGLREAGGDGRLPGHVLAQAGGKDVAADDFVDRLGGNAGPLERRLDGDAAELLGRKG